MADMAQGAAGSGADRRRLWLILAVVLALIGVVVSIYSTKHHLDVKATGQTDAACNVNATFNCDDVALSPYSEIANVPLGIIGLGYFAAILVLLGIGLSKSKAADEHIHAYVALVVIGVVTSVVLASISYFQVGAFCLTCMGIYSLTLLQAVLLFAFRKEIPGNLTFKGLTSGGSTGAIAVAVVIALFAFLWPKPAPEVESPTVATSEEEAPAPELATKVQDIPIAKSAYAGLGEDYRKGGDNAAVTIVEFADFQCPACQRASMTLRELQKEYGDKVLIVFRNYPLDQSCNAGIKSKLHEYACRAAIMGRCAGQYGKFWEYHDLVFTNQRDLNEANLRKWSKDLGQTDEQIDACWNSPDHLAKIKDDITTGDKIGVDSTPTLFINGQKVVGGRGINDLRKQIDSLAN